MTTPSPTTFIQPYLFFSGRCEEAVELYRTVLGAEVDMLIRFKDSRSHIRPACFRLDGKTK